MESSETPPPAETEPMDIHKPKAAHSWREFLTEIGTIVCGILIALGLEQLVVRAEWAHKVEAAETAMLHELLEDDGPQVYQRVVMHDCLVASLDGIRAGIEHNASRADMVRLVNSYRVSFLSYDTRARDDASHTGAMEHVPPARQDVFDASYDQMPYMEKTNGDEALAIGRLRALKQTGGPLDAAEQARVLDALEEARVLEYRMWSAATFMLPQIRKLGDIDPVRQAHFLGEVRQWYGTACILKLPADWRISPETRRKSGYYQ